MKTFICKICKKEFLRERVRNPNKTFCSNHCHGLSRKKDIHAQYLVDQKGYAFYYDYRPKRKKIFIHRETMEKILGRQLNTKEIVHHKDENKLNNNPENLILIDRKSHSSLHRLGKKRS